MVTLENILTSLGIEKSRIMPTNFIQKIHRPKSNFFQLRSDIPFFPLEWFDSNPNLDDCTLLFAYCQEGIAFLPSSSPTSNDHHHDYDYEWRKVSIKHFNDESNKWHIEDVESGMSYEVPRIYLMFSAEKPVVFAKRIQSAIQLRENCVCHLRFETLLNTHFQIGGFSPSLLPYLQTPPVRFDERIKKQLPQLQRKNEMKKIKETESQTETDDDDEESTALIEFYQREFAIVYQKTMAALHLIKNSPASSASKAACWIELLDERRKIRKVVRPRMERERLRNLTMECLQNAPIEETRKSIQMLWLYCCPQSIKLIEFINNECEDVSCMSLFHLQTSRCTWDEFCRDNSTKLQTMSNFLQAQWIEKIVRRVRWYTGRIGKGWFDVRISSWSTFKMSKIHRLIELIKQRMEVSIMNLLKSSLRAFVNHLCQPCECLLYIYDHSTFIWPDDNLHRTPFLSQSTPIFNTHLDIDCAAMMPKYSILNLESGIMEIEIVEMFEKRILTTHQIPQIDPHLMKNLKLDGKSMKLSSIGMLNEEIQNQICYLRLCYRKCLIPLLAYAQQYKKFVYLKTLDVVHYIQLKNLSTSYDMSYEIYDQLKLIDELKASMPESIIIGPFFIIVEELRNSLIEKRMEIVNTVKDMMMEMAREKVIDIQQRYDAIIERLIEIPATIEHLDDIAKWIPSVANEIDELAYEMREVVATEFACIESLYIALPDDMFTMKWKALQMPQIVNCRINETLKQHERDVERFRKSHSNDETAFKERLDGIARDVDECIRKCNFDTWQMKSLEIDRLWRVLQGALERGKLLNRRCEILNQPEIDMEDRLTAHIHQLFPHHKFWTMTSNFLTSKEMWLAQMPLSTLDMQFIEAEMRRYDEIVEESREHFTNVNGDDVENGKTDMLGAVERATLELREMSEFFDIIKDLKNPDFCNQQWQGLCAIGDEWSEFKYFSATTTFNELLSLGINKVADVVKQITIEAVECATREREEAIEQTRRREREEEAKRREKLQRFARHDVFIN